MQIHTETVQPASGEKEDDKPSDWSEPTLLTLPSDKQTNTPSHAPAIE